MDSEHGERETVDIDIMKARKVPGFFNSMLGNARVKKFGHKVFLLSRVRGIVCDRNA